jgi:hypothetical protein
MNTASVEVRSNLIPAYIRNLHKISAIVGMTVANVEATAKKSIADSSGQYKAYTRGKKRKRIHWSSPPGTPPNSDTGFLKNHIYSRMVTKYSGIVFSSAKYSIPLELGWYSKKGKRIPKRPFLLPALQKEAPEMINRIKALLK